MELVIPGAGKCRVCGCTDRRACPSRCYWVLGDLCSDCVKLGCLLVVLEQLEGDPSFAKRIRTLKKLPMVEAMLVADLVEGGVACNGNGRKPSASSALAVRPSSKAATASSSSPARSRKKRRSG